MAAHSWIDCLPFGPSAPPPAPQRAGSVAGIVWLDAHGDVQTLETTASGYLGGLPLRLLVGYRPELIAARLGLRPVPEQQVLLVGARDLDPPEVSYLDSAPVRRAQVADLDRAVLPDGPVYLHIDLDVIDSAEIPGLRFPAPGGPGPARVAGQWNGCSAPARSPRWASPAPGAPAMTPRRASARTSGRRLPRPAAEACRWLTRRKAHRCPASAGRHGRPARSGPVR